MKKAYIAYSKGILVFLGVILSGVFVAVLPAPAKASDCGIPLSASGYFFDSYHSTEYINNFLVLHFKIKDTEATGSSWKTNPTFLSDECRSGTVQSFEQWVSLTPGVRYFSVRFLSPTRFEIWNDETNTPEPCANCVQDFPAFPGYYFFSFFAFAGGGASFIQAPAYRISNIAEDAPVKTETLATPSGCQPFRTGGTFPYFFDNYERAEYANGLLAYHFRFKTPYNDGRIWRLTTSLHKNDCISAQSIVVGATPVTNIALTKYMRYYSIRFSSPTHFDIWNDETNQKEICPTCSVDLPATLATGQPYSFVSFAGLIDGGASTFQSTPFPVQDATIPECCSSVLFLPGIEASKLYLDGERVWPPQIIHDNSVLFLKEDGTPRNEGIYTQDILDEAYGANIYKTFASDMDTLAAEGIIAGWKAFPYDWRFDINDVVNNPTKLTATTTLLLAELEKLAQESQTKKVTIIAHSNGGLVGKLLIEELKRQGKTNLVDRFVMVAVPQLGTPKAVSTLLHGESLPFSKLPFLMMASTARTLAENMSPGYTLLPSPEYFARVLDPVVEFEPGMQSTKIYTDNYGFAITNRTELENFLLGAEGRSDPAASDTRTPNIINSSLLSAADSTQYVLDHWEPPAGIEVIQIAGWGIPTIRGIKYYEKDISSPSCSVDCVFLDHEPIMTIDGDSTVVVPSAIAERKSVNYFINLKKYNNLLNFRRDRRHADILEVKDALDVINFLLQEKQILITPIITSDKPSLSSSDDQSIYLKVHSPVSLDIYEHGRHTGISTTTPFYPDSIVEEQIPNSYYLEMGEGKYAGADIFGTTTVKLVGQDFGEFTLDIEKTAGDTIIASSMFAGIPVAVGSLVSLEVFSDTNAPVLNVDINGDGLVDAAISSGEGLTTGELIGILMGFIKTLHLPEEREALLLKKVDKLAKTLSGDYYKKQKTEHAFTNLMGAIDQFVKKGLLTTEEADEIKSIIGKIQGIVIY